MAESDSKRILKIGSDLTDLRHEFGGLLFLEHCI